MSEMAYFELFGRISDKFVTEALIPPVIPVPVPKQGFRQTPFGRFLASPAFVAVIGGIAALAVAVAVGVGLAGRGDEPGLPFDSANESGVTTSDRETEEGSGSVTDEGYTDEEHTDRDTDESVTDERVTDEDTVSDSESYGDHPYIARKSYGNDLGIIYGKDLMGEGFAYLPEDMVFAGATALNANLYERIEKTKDYLGVSIGLVERENDNAVLDTVGKMSGAGENDNYFVIASGRAIARLGGFDQFMTPWESLEAINTDADYWDTALMQTHTQAGHSYIAYNSFIPPNAYAIAYNKSIYATSPNQRDLYSLVESGDWTVDTLMSVLNETASINGRLAIPEYASVNPYLTAVGFRVTDTVESEGGYTQSFNMAERREALKPLYLRVLDLISGEWTLHVAVVNDSIPIIEQDELLMDTRLTRDLASKAYGKPIGVLPLPKYDKAQSGYLSLHVNAYMGLWCAEESRQMCGEVAELLAYFSRNSYEDYNRAVMGVYGKDDSGVQRDLAMLRIIHNTTHDLGMTYPGLNVYLVSPLLNGQSEMPTGDASQIKNMIRIAQRETGW